MKIMRAPSWITGHGAMRVVGALATLVVLGGVGLLASRRQVRRQTAQIRDQLGRQGALEAELERDKRARVIGALAGGIAHDFNNLLTGVVGNLSLLEANSQVMALAGDSVSEASAASAKARQLTAQLVTLSRGGAPVKRTIALLPWLEGIVKEVVPDGWQVLASMPVNPIELEVDPAQLGSAVQTLVGHFAEHPRATGWWS